MNDCNNCYGNAIHNLQIVKVWSVLRKREYFRKLFGHCFKSDSFYWQLAAITQQQQQQQQMHFHLQKDANNQCSWLDLAKLHWNCLEFSKRFLRCPWPNTHTDRQTNVKIFIYINLNCSKIHSQAFIRNHQSWEFSSTDDYDRHGALKAAKWFWSFHLQLQLQLLISLLLLFLVRKFAIAQTRSIINLLARKFC